MSKSPAAAAAALTLTLSVALGMPASALGVHGQAASLSGESAPMLFPAQAFDATAASWPQFGYDAGHSGDNPLEKTLNAQNVGSLQVAWSRPIIQPSGIVVDAGTAYVADQGQSPGAVYALGTIKGAQRWVTDVGLTGSWGSFAAVPAVSGGVVLTPCSNQSSSNFRTGVCGLNAKTGKVLWSDLCFASGGGCGGLTNHGTSPSVYNGRAYFQMTNIPNEQPDIYAVNPTNGHVIWDVGGPYLFHCPDAGGPINPLPAANGHVFAVLACQTHGSQTVTEICSLSASTGNAAWCTISQSAYVDRLIEGQGKVFASESIGSGTSIVAMNENTGRVLWTSASLPHNVGAIAVDKNRVFVNNYFSLYALSTVNGRTIWTQTQDTAGGTVSVANGIVYTNTFGGNNGDDAITALDEKTGTLIWASSPVGNGSSVATPVILNGSIYAACYNMCAFKLPGKLLQP